MALSIGSFYFWCGYLVAFVVACIVGLVFKKSISVILFIMAIPVICGWLMYFGLIPTPPMFYPNCIGELLFISKGVVSGYYLIATSALLLFYVWYVYIRGCF
jgi:hypothetical protein